MPLDVRAVARSHVGLVRSGNEDSGYAGRSLFVIADGMGGHAAGEVASRTVVAALLGLDGADLGPDPGATLRSAVTEANERLRLAVDARPDLEGMGTTLTALVWDGLHMALAHVGDSRAYLLRDGHLRMLTHDQTLVQALVDEGRITEEEARTHPQHAVILQAMDGRADLEPVIQLIEPRAHDRYLVCSDGLTGYVEESAVEDVLTGRDAAAAVDGLIGIALEAGAPDNVTVVVVDVVESADADAPDDSRDAATHEPGGVLVGAVGETGAASTAVIATGPADPSPGGAGGDSDTPSSPTSTLDLDQEVDQEEDDVDDAVASSGHRRRRRRWPWLVGLLVLLAVGAAVAGKTWASDQWYVGVDAGYVAVFTGLDLSLGPISLSELSERTTLETATLPEYARAEVEGGMTATSEADAQEIVANLRAAADQCLTAPETLGCP